MAETAQQSFENHARFVPAYHMGAFGIFVINLAVSLAQVSGGDVDDPWEAHTLEWTREPESITVTSNTPLLDARDASTVGGGV